MKKKIFSLKDLSKKISIFKKRGKKVVHCHGVFDILHAGHVKHFNSSKKYGDILVVTVTHDQYVNKGPNRPIFPTDVRMQCIAALENVDYVCSNSNKSAVKAIKLLKPNVYCKGKDYMDNKLDVTGKINQELKAIKSVGGRIVYTNDELYSSSKIINSSGLNLNEKQRSFLTSLKKEIVTKDIDVAKLISSFSDLKVLVIGETIIDEYIYCDPLGKSGKEPVLAVKDLYSKKFLGGTISIARNLASFCKKVTVLSCIGEKKEQLSFLTKKLEKNIYPLFIKKKNSPTIIKKRYVDEVTKSKILGVYSIEDQVISKKEEKIVSRNIIKQIKKHDVVIVSDYGHGFITEKLASLIIKNSKFAAVNAQLNAANIGFHTISKFKNADLVIINENEMRHEMRNKIDEVNILIKELANKLRAKFTTVTSGNMGSKIYIRKSRKLFSCPAFAKRVTDKIGTGDTMLALLSVAIYNKTDINFSMFMSALAAAINIQHMGNSVPLKRVNFIKAIQSYLS